MVWGENDNTIDLFINPFIHLFTLRFCLKGMRFKKDKNASCLQGVCSLVKMDKHTHKAMKAIRELRQIRKV